jgi:hypothetical protein
MKLSDHAIGAWGLVLALIGVVLAALGVWVAVLGSPQWTRNDRFCYIFTYGHACFSTRSECEREAAKSPRNQIDRGCQRDEGEPR